MKLLRTIPALPVQSIAQSVAFYRDKLGFTVGHVEDTFAILQRDDAEIHLWAACDENWRHRSNAEPVVSGAESFIAGTASCRIEVTGVDKLYQELQSRNVLHANGEIVNQPYGVREFHVVDLENNLLTFFERI